MVRPPPNEKTGLKKGPWTAEEDHVLISYIHRHGHPNWRALPKLAGLMRCGKSCRLRWINYLRPDIKRGNFTREEEEAIISLHGMLGNRWSVIAAKLPGRTDNEIKNIWHTNLKKRVNSSSNTFQERIHGPQNAPSHLNPQTSPINLQLDIESHLDCLNQSTSTSVSLIRTSSIQTESEISYQGIENNDTTMFSNGTSKELLQFPELEGGSWWEALEMENPNTSKAISPPFESLFLSNAPTDDDDDKDFWQRMLSEAGGLHSVADPRVADPRVVTCRHVPTRGFCFSF